MSLVGSLEDLGLGDILQIVSLSRKSGLLLIHSEQGEGRIVFCDGLVRAAYVKGEPEDLRSLVVEAGFISGEDFDRAAELSSAHGVPVAESLSECTSLTRESLDSLRREQVERAVFRIFSWVVGEFSFEVRDEIDARDLEILIPTGINAQYLTMEATRLDDEGARGSEGAESAVAEDGAAISEMDDGPIFFSGETDSDGSSDFGSPPSAREVVDPNDAVELDLASAEPEIASMERDSSADAASPEAVLAFAATRREAPELEVEQSAVAPVEENPTVAPVEESPTVAPVEESPTVAPVEESPTVAPVEERPAVAPVEERPSVAPVEERPAVAPVEERPAVAPVEERPAVAPAAAGSREEAPPRPGVAAVSLIAIDPNLSSLEWQKLNLAPFFSRVHIFQNGESGIARIRQYLRRGEIPVVLVSIDLAAEKISGVESLAEFIRRLKLLASSMPVLVVRYEEAQSGESIDAADAILTGPDPAALINRKAWPKLTEEAERFRTEIAGWLKQPVQSPSDSNRAVRSSTTSDATDSENLRTLRAVSERIRDPANHGEVLKLVLKFASERLSRVAMFMVRDEMALGVAQIGLPRGGGPDDAQFREIELPAADVEWFKSVLDARTSLCSPVIGDGDRALARRIGDREPAQAYVAPIVSGGRVVALLYGDNLPGEESVGDTSVIEIALHEAGLALERVLLERALAQIGDPSAS
ncbi:MAG: DUF4388 domain-containing protein [Myxococcales bacterium]|nr:DUF4388 domain-containing protein [Myxococcales bacterium]